MEAPASIPSLHLTITRMFIYDLTINQVLASSPFQSQSTSHLPPRIRCRIWRNFWLSGQASRIPNDDQPHSPRPAHTRRHDLLEPHLGFSTQRPRLVSNPEDCVYTFCTSIRTCFHPPYALLWKRNTRAVQGWDLNHHTFGDSRFCSIASCSCCPQATLGCLGLGLPAYEHVSTSWRKKKRYGRSTEGTVRLACQWRLKKWQHVDTLLVINI